MKKLLFITATLALLTSCKKEDLPEKETTKTETPKVSNKDSKFIGTWALDSSQIDGHLVSVYSKDTMIVSDKLKKITSVSEIRYEYNYEWKTTESDSIYIGPATYVLDDIKYSLHYKYFFSGNNLILISNKLNSGGIATTYWYSKL